MIIIAVGNACRSDDAVRLLVARRLRESAPEGVVVLERDGEPASLIEAWAGAGAVILVDAVSSGVRPGALHVIDARKALLEGAEKATSAVLRMIQEMGFDPTHD